LGISRFDTAALKRACSHPDPHGPEYTVLHLKAPHLISLRQNHHYV